MDRLELGEPRLDPAPVRTQAFLGVVAGENAPDLVERDVELVRPLRRATRPIASSSVRVAIDRSVGIPPTERSRGAG